MSLKIWLPLTQDLRNQGSEIENFTDTGATLASTTGPLGASYSFNGSNNQIYGSYTCAEAEFSVCLWVNFSKLNIHLIDMRNSDGVGYQPAYVNASSGIQVGGSNSSWPYINFVPELNTWYHLAIVYSSTKTQLYVDGEFYGETTSSYATNFNKKIDIHIGSRYTGANWFGGYVSDFRLYNHILSAYEVKEIAQGLLLHYKGDVRDGELIDSSGFNRNGASTTTETETSALTRYGKSLRVGQSVDNYVTATSPSSLTKTISFWIKTPKAATTVAFADFKSKMGFGFNASGVIIASCDSLSIPMYDSSNLLANTYTFITLRKTVAGTDVELFINGVKQTGRSSNNYWTHSTNTLMIGRRSTGTPMNCYISDFRMYATRLGDDDILDLYHTSLKQGENGNAYPFELVEGSTNSVTRSGKLITSGEFVESGSINSIKSNQIISKEFIER